MPFPRRSCELSLDASQPRVPGAGAMLRATGMHARLAGARSHYPAPPSPAPEDGQLRSYDPDRDWAECCRLRDRFHAEHTGGPVDWQPPVSPASGADPSQQRWVFAAGDGLHAYLFARQQGATLEIADAAGDPGHLEALGDIVRHALEEGARRGAHRAVGRLPADERVAEALLQAGVDVLLSESQAALGSNMRLLLSLSRFADVAVPEWSRRLREAGTAPWRGVLELHIQDQAVKLALTADGVEIAAGSQRPDACLEFPLRAFLLAALGYRSWGEVAAHTEGDRSPALTSTLGLLFPRQPCVAGLLG